MSRDPVKDLVAFVQWLSQNTPYYVDDLSEHEIREMAEKWYENQYGDEHG